MLDVLHDWFLYVFATPESVLGYSWLYFEESQLDGAGTKKDPWNQTHVSSIQSQCFPIVLEHRPSFILI